MRPQVVDFIRQNGIDKLEKDFFINVKRHTRYPNLVLLKYNQIDSPMSIPLVQECRGLILDETNDWKVVCYPFKKFFNYLESNAAKIDWTNRPRVYEKLDGSIMVLYWYDNHWEVSSSGTPDASGQVGDFGFTFADLFWRVWKEKGYKLPDDHNQCHMFELMTPWNTIVVQHHENRLVLHGGRNLTTFREINPIVEAHNNDWECVKTFPLNSLEAAVEMAKGMDGTKQEGFVVCDSDYNRVKLKCENYVSLSHLKESCGSSKRQMLEIIRRGESEEFLNYFPAFKDTFYDIKAKYERLLGQCEGAYEMVKDIPDRKTLAAKIMGSALGKQISGLLFAMKDGKISSFKVGLAEIHIKSLESMLGIKGEENEGV